MKAYAWLLVVGSFLVNHSAFAKDSLFDHVQTKSRDVRAKGGSYSWVNAYAFAVGSRYAYPVPYTIKTKKGRSYTDGEYAAERYAEIGLKFCQSGQETQYVGEVPGDKIRDESWNSKMKRVSVDTQYYLVYNDNLVAVFFRGSESSSWGKFWRDWANTDARFLWAEPWDKIKRIHRGFYWAYASVDVKQALAERIKKCISRTDPNDPNSKPLQKKRALFFAGHSLGGAVAHVAALDLFQHYKVPVRGVYSYGAPRAFGQKSGAHYDDKLGAVTHRWVNKNDLVTGLPGPGFHRHVGRYHHIRRGTINKAKQYVELDRKPHLPRVPAWWDHYMENYVSLIWKYMPTKAKRGSLGASYNQYSDAKMMKLGGYPKALCEMDNDCKGGRWCDRGTLYIGKNQCKKKLAKGKVCIRDGQCKSGTCNLLFRCGKSDGCEKDSHCGKGKWCDKRLGRKNLCRPKGKLGKSCMRDGQCKSGECNILFECVKKRKKKDDGCQKDKHCGKGKWCDGRLGKKNLCRAKKKLGKRCARDGQCKSGQCNWKFKCAKK